MSTAEQNRAELDADQAGHTRSLLFPGIGESAGSDGCDDGPAPSATMIDAIRMRLGFICCIYICNVYIHICIMYIYLYTD